MPRPTTVEAREGVCRVCGKAFVARTRAARCTTCIHKANGKDLCACGQEKQRKSEQCKQCSAGDVAPLTPMDQPHAAWVAGLMEGEGTFLPRPDRPGGYIRVQMTDEDVIQRLRDVIGAGRINAYTPKNPNHKPSWIFTIQRRDHVFGLVDQLAHLMCDRRRSAIQAMLNSFTDPPQISPQTVDIGGLDDPVAAAWLAGMIEGEGYIGPGRISIASTDEDVLQRVLSITRSGAIQKEGRRRDHHRDVFVWRVFSQHERARIVTAIFPWLLSRRRETVGTVGLEPTLTRT